MPKYIEKGVAMQEIELVEIKEPEGGDIVTAILNAAQRKIAEAPAADVAPVRHGKWRITKHFEKPICSVCGTDSLLTHAHKLATPNYCPNCGAKMDLEDQ